MSVIESPCINICVIAPETGLCRGCGRSLKEIAQWLQLSPNERRRIMMELPGRLAAKPRPIAAAAP